MKAEDVMYNLGVPVAHSSMEDGGADVGLSLGLGGKMLYIGDAPDVPHKGWSIVIYPLHGEREVVGIVLEDKGTVLMDALFAAIRAAQGATFPRFRPRTTAEEDASLIWPPTPELRMEGAMVLWEAIVEAWGYDAEAMAGLLEHKEKVGSVQMRHDLMPIVDMLHVGWHIHQLAAGDEAMVPFDWEFTPWFLINCVEATGGVLSCKGGWEDACRALRAEKDESSPAAPPPDELALAIKAIEDQSMIAGKMTDLAVTLRSFLEEPAKKGDQKWHLN